MHIGEVARSTGMSVKTIRYYSDLGLVPEAARTAAGYRRYDGSAVVRLEYVRTLRELGLDLATIRRVLDRRDDLRAVAAAHANALDARIRLLRTQRAALRALAKHAGPAGETLTPREVDRMTRLAQATADERRRLIDEFLDSIFEGVNMEPGSGGADFAAGLRRAMPELPDDPSEEQVDAWIELAELVHDDDFRARLREMSLRSFGTPENANVPPSAMPASEEAAALIAGRAGSAVGAEIDPRSPAATVIRDQMVEELARLAGREPDDTYRQELKEQIALGYEPRAERYWQLIAVINGWPPIPAAMPAWRWFLESLDRP